MKKIEVFFIISLFISISSHALILWKLLSREKKWIPEGVIYRPSTTIYVKLREARKYTVGKSRRKKYSSKRSKAKKVRIRGKYGEKGKRVIRVGGKVSGNKEKRVAPVDTDIGAKGGFEGGSGAIPSEIYLGEYYNTIWSMIKERWSIPEYLKGKNLRAVISIRIKRSGKIEKIYIEKSSGNRLFDNCAIKVIKSLGSFPPLPDYVKNNTLEIGVIFKE